MWSVVCALKARESSSLVSMDLPPLMQQALAPEPRWATTMLILSSGFLRYLDKVLTIDAYESPWKPY